MDDKKFIYCRDEKLSESLRKYYKQVGESNGLIIFLNEPISELAFNFSNIDKKKYTYSNKLLF